jgi:predicted histone-like DNA-binding protein
MIKYKVIAKSEPGVKGGGKLRYCAAPSNRTLIEFEDVSREISKVSSFSRGDIHGVLSSFVELIIDHIQLGASVRLGDLGIFSISISSDMKDSPEEVNSDCIRELRLNFRPSVEIKDELKRVSFVRDRGN